MCINSCAGVQPRCSDDRILDPANEEEVKRSNYQKIIGVAKEQIGTKKAVFYKDEEHAAASNLEGKKIRNQFIGISVAVAAIVIAAIALPVILAATVTPLCALSLLLTLFLAGVSSVLFAIPSFELQQQKKRYAETMQPIVKQACVQWKADYIAAQKDSQAVERMKADAELIVKRGRDDTFPDIYDTAKSIVEDKWKSVLPWERHTSHILNKVGDERKKEGERIAEELKAEKEKREEQSEKVKSSIQQEGLNDAEAVEKAVEEVRQSNVRVKELTAIHNGLEQPFNIDDAAMAALYVDLFTEFRLDKEEKKTLDAFRKGVLSHKQFIDAANPILAHRGAINRHYNPVAQITTYGLKEPAQQEGLQLYKAFFKARAS